MQVAAPTSAPELAAMLADAAAAGKSIQLGGAFSKDRVGGPIAKSDTVITTTRLNRVLQYEPQDLTISVEGGITYRELSALLAKNSQMIPLDPPFADSATIGGIVATNSSGPRRRLYGTARDMVIGMKFATLEGKLVQSGGMVVKNVAGLDMAKVMIGSYGTLAAIAVINFKLIPMPVMARTWVRSFSSLAEAIAARDKLLRGVLQPTAVDIVNAHAAPLFGGEGFLLLVEAGGNEAAVARYGAGGICGDAEAALWTRVREFVPDFLATHEEGAVVRVSGALAEVEPILATLPVPAIARAGSGVVYGVFADCEAAIHWVRDARWPAVVEYGPHQRSGELWPKPGSDFAIMKMVKDMFDPKHLLNRGRLYGRL